MSEECALMLNEVIVQVEDYLFPQLQFSAWERVIYYRLLRNTFAINQNETIISIEALARATSMSGFKVREVLRSLDAKGCIKILERNRIGHRIRLLLPSEIPALQVSGDSISPPDLEGLDFYRSRTYVTALLEREAGCCFYCLRQISSEACVLDHVKPLVDGGDSSFRNVVVACHECNSLKQGADGEQFLRILYRKNILSPTELEGRMLQLQRLREGSLKPRLP